MAIGRRRLNQPLRFQLLPHGRLGIVPHLLELISAGEVYVEIAMLEGVGGVANLVAHAPSDRLLFGSHAPLFYFESALLKLKESPLTAEHFGAIRHKNAQRLMAMMR